MKPSLLLLAAICYLPTAMADARDARCDIYPAGQDQASAVMACTYSQHQGHVSIQRADGVVHDLVVDSKETGLYRDREGHRVRRNDDLGKQGSIFEFPDETVYVYWDTAGIPGTNSRDNYTAPYTTADYDATARFPCALDAQASWRGGDCPAGIQREATNGVTQVRIMRPDGVERVLVFKGDKVTSSGKGKVRATLGEDDWSVEIDGRESYLVPVALIEGD